MSKKKIISWVGLAVCLIVMSGSVLAQSTLAAQEETIDQNTNQVTLTLLPKESGSTGANSGNKSLNNRNTMFLKTGEQSNLLLTILGYVLVSMGVIYIVYLSRRKVENNEK